VRTGLNIERGSLTLELAVIAPALVALLLFIAGAASIQNARGDLDDAVWEAARAASLTRSEPDADAVAHQAVDQRLSGEKWRCADQAVTVDLTRFNPGGNVAVDITCSLRLSDAFAIFPGQMRLHSRATEPLEPFRALR
jgi:Flp pilus assembly protein TadG